MTARRHLAAEIGRFLAVGGLATLVSFVLFNLLLHGVVLDPVLAHQPVLAYVLANTVGMWVSYSGSRYFAFRDRESTHRDGGRTAYVVINVVTMSLPIACLWLSRHGLGLTDPVSDNVAANLVGLGLSTAARFWLFRTFVFHRPVHLLELYGEPELTHGEITITAPTGPATSAPAVPRAT